MRMVFKPRSTPPKTRDSIANKVMADLNARDADRKVADAATAKGQALEEAGKDEEAVGAYLEAVDAYTKHFHATNHEAPALPFYRLGVLLRRFEDPAAEVQVLQRYMVIAGRSPDIQLVHRLERAEELLELLEESLEDEDFED